MKSTLKFWLIIGFAVPIFVFGSCVTTVWSCSIGAPIIDWLSMKELDTGRQTHVSIFTGDF